jgi:hypothetical protein
MQWRKLGRIFDPTQHSLPNQCKHFAKSPQALVFDNFVLIYFSTCAQDSSGKLLSHVAYVDMRKNLRNIMRVSEKSVIPLGELGCFDEHGIFPFNVLRHGSAIYAYTSGWNRRFSVSVETAIGLAISRDDGLTFQRHGQGPVLAASLHEPCLIVDAFVKVIHGTFHMWYIFGTGWKQYAPNIPPDRTYKIGHASSSDGIDWQREEGRQIISDRLGPGESQALPCVIETDRRYHMFFCYRQSFDFRTAKSRSYRIGHAWSDDLANWKREDDCPHLAVGNPGEWDCEMQCYPHVFECEGKIYLLYNGNEFGRYGFGLAQLER